MAIPYDVSIKVVSQTGTCHARQKVNDEWIVTGEEYPTGYCNPVGMCMVAFHNLFPTLRILRMGGSYPWESNPISTTIACPDMKNPVVYELKRIEK